MSTLYQKTILRGLEKARHGQLHLTLPNGESLVFGTASVKDNAVDMNIHNTDTFKKLCLDQGIGLGEAYQLGYWSSNNLTALLEWFCANLPLIAPKSTPTTRFAFATFRKALTVFEHWRNRNTIAQSERNIHAHYDLGNSFYRAFLDRSLTYSSAYFASQDQDLEQAQYEKYERLCQKLNLQPEHTVLEIGCGWGGFSLYAASRYGCKITCVTISKEQYKVASQRVADANLANRIEILYQDYRSIRGRFDRIASIEMLEAVGEDFLDGYFTQVEHLLKPQGLAAVQVITTPNPLYGKYRKRVDWIQKHIFPGSHLPSSRRLLSAAEHAELDVFHLETFGLHYAKTLMLWRQQFIENESDIAKQGFDEAFRRKWEFYLAYCEAGFRQRHINVMQMVFGRPDEIAYNFEDRTGTVTPRDLELELANAS